MKSKKWAIVSLVAICMAAMAFGSFQQSLAFLQYPKWDTYEKQWAKVDSLNKKGLSKTAFEEVAKLYERAKKEGNAPQLIRSVIYSHGISKNYQEEALESSIAFVENELKQLQFPARPVLHSVLAELYLQYFRNNRWRFYERSQTTGFSNEDIRTWDLFKIHSAITEQYLLSLENRDSLKKVRVDVFDPVLIGADSLSKSFRPTLFDFLGHRALNYFTNEENHLAQPTYEFRIKDTEAFAPIAQFTSHTFETRDSTSPKYQALLLFQELLAFHSNSDPVVLVDLDLKRLKFVKENAEFQNTDSLYYLALRELKAEIGNHASSAEISYEIANWHFLRGMGYLQLNKPEVRWENKMAWETCTKAIAGFPESFGAKQCLRLKAKIEEKNLGLQHEKTIIPGQPALAMLSYRNLKKAHFRIVRDTHNFTQTQRNRYGDEFVKEMVSNKPIKEWAVEVDDEGDFQPHRIEIPLPELPMGKYVLLVSESQGFSFNKDAIAYSTLQVSNISFIGRRQNNGTYDVYVLDRNTGAPIKGAGVHAWTRQYDYTTRQNTYTKTGSYQSDASGYAGIPFSGKDYYNFFLEINADKDHYISEQGLSQYKSNQGTHKTERIHFFTDRAIYRPGQTLHFKGIALETTGKETQVQTGKKTTVTLFDVNQQKISELQLTSNDYGTFSGTFTLPSTGLTGQMSIQAENSMHYFQVEEYKRPKFEVQFQALKGAYRLGDKIPVVAKAMSYSGEPVDGAQVNYRVVRNPIYPIWWFRGGWQPERPAQEIASGITTTNREGGFEISFDALAASKNDKGQISHYDFTIYADVTDQAGETRQGEHIIPIGFVALQVHAALPRFLNKKSIEAIPVTTKNLNGEPEPSILKIKAYQLRMPENPIKERLWNQPDQYLMNRNEFKQLFPFDAYKNENEPQNWEKQSLVFESTLNTGETDYVEFGKIKNWTSGLYLFEAETIDKYGETVKESVFFTVFSENDKKPPVHTPDWFTVLHGNPEPGEQARILIGSPLQDVQVLVEVEHNMEIVKKSWYRLNNEQKILEFPVEEKHRGNFALHLVFVHGNRVYRHSQNIVVPYTNKELVAEFQSFRDKLQPGQQEEWTVKIRGKKGEKQAAELLASMYDASLDAFVAHNWQFDIYKRQTPFLGWENNPAFGITYTNLLAPAWNNLPPTQQRKHYALNWFGFGDYSARFGSYAKGAMPEMAMAVNDADMEEVLAKDAIGNAKSENGQSPKKEPPPIMQAQPRKNFNETAFFFPHLMTDEQSNVIIKFTLPESLTRWKLQGLAHTTDLKYTLITKELLAQKDLMVRTNLPRFFREGDEISIAANIVNLTNKEKQGKARLELVDPYTNAPIAGILATQDIPESDFVVGPKSSTSVKWKLKIPEGIQAITVRISAVSGQYTDGEEMAIPVLSNRMLLTESLPLPVRGKETKEFTFQKLLAEKSSTLKNHQLTLEYTANPAWYAVQALPYLMEFPYDCSEQVFSRYYANSIAAHIANSNAKIKSVFEQWKNFGPDALLSAMEKNQDLKNIVLEETPWVMQAKGETERKKRLGLLFDLNKMADEQARSEELLLKMQTPNGGFPWFAGMRDDRFITQYIVTGYGRLRHLGIGQEGKNPKLGPAIQKAISYLDDRLAEDYKELLKHKTDTSEKSFHAIHVQYFYARSFFKEQAVAGKNKPAYDFYFRQMKKFWLDESRYLQAMAALALHRRGEQKVPADITKSLKNNSLHNEEMGMYWKENVAGFYWYQAPVETQSLLIEAFDEVAKDVNSVEEMKVWLLKQKQTQDWKSTKATAEACYALLLRGTDILAHEPDILISLGMEKFDLKNINDKEAGTGYFKTSWNAGEIKAEMGKVKVENNSEGIAWGAVYW